MPGTLDQHELAAAVQLREQAPTVRGGNRRVPRPLPALAVGSVLFTVLLVLVTLEWAPLRSLDRSVSLELNELVGGSGPAAGVLRTVTDLGDPVVTAGVLSVLTAVLLVRWRRCDRDA